MSPTQPASEKTSAWYFIGATFILAGSVFARTLFDAHLLASIAIVVGVVALIVGFVVLSRERRARSGRDGTSLGDDRTEV